MVKTMQYALPGHKHKVKCHVKYAFSLFIILKRNDEQLAKTLFVQYRPFCICMLCIFSRSYHKGKVKGYVTSMREHSLISGFNRT